MTLDRDAVLAGIPAELADFGTLVGSLSPDDLELPTRCEGWTVAHVAGHVIGTVVDLTEGRLQGQGTPEVTYRQANERAGRTAAVLADELSTATPALTTLLASLPAEAWDGPSLTGADYTLGFAIEAIWYDAYVHADDIRATFGTPPTRGPGLSCAVQHVAGYLEHRGVALSLNLDGLAPIEVHGGGPVVTGDPHQFLLLATGRADPGALGLMPTINVYSDLTAQS